MLHIRFTVVITTCFIKATQNTHRHLKNVLDAFLFSLECFFFLKYELKIEPPPLTPDPETLNSNIHYKMTPEKKKKKHSWREGKREDTQRAQAA